MIKIESVTLEQAYNDAATALECSVTELKIEVVQYPSRGLLGLFKKNAIIVATQDMRKAEESLEPKTKDESKETNTILKSDLEEKRTNTKATKVNKPEVKSEEAVKNRRPSALKKEKQEEFSNSHTMLNNTIMPTSFVSTQDDEDEMHYEPVYADESYDEDIDTLDLAQTALIVKEEINRLFDLTCFKIDEIDVSVYDANTLLIEFKGEDAALLIGKEGYRYKALSYMIFNWINTKYQVQLRLEIAEFLKNQEEAVSRYLVNVCENVDRDGRAQTKILDGVLVQIALRELRDRYADKYVAIRSTRDGLKYIIINDYHTN
jgi:spoIIIJ-associated protein